MIWRFGEFELDEARCELRRKGQPVALRRKVFDVLTYLVTHRDRLVTKEELLHGVWPGEAIQESVIAQNIAILRRALGDSRRSADTIQTVHGRGYRFVAEVALHEREAPSGAPSASAHSLPFVGREHVMGELRKLLRGIFSGKGRFAVITGEPGIGKTRTSEELATEARSLGARVLEGRCHEGAGAPAYWPFMQILRAAAEDRGLARQGRLGSDAQQLLASLRGRSEERSQPLDPSSARFRLFDDVLSWLSRLSRTQPVVLVLDDLHWSDEATLHLLRFVAHEVRGLPLLVIGTSREIDPRADPAVGALLGSLVSSSHAQRLYLGGLSLEATRELVHASLGQALDDATLRELQTLTEGNPFFLHEIAQLLGAGGALPSPRAGVPLALPPRVLEVIAMRLRALGPELERVLSLASVIGRDFSLTLLGQLSELPRDALLGLLERATSARIIRPATSAGFDEPDAAATGHYAFTHALIRESLYGALPEPERVRLHGRVGLALEALLGVDAEPQLDQLAHHFFLAAPGGDIERAVGYCARAARRASSRLAFEQAATYYQRALTALASRLPIDERRRFELKLALGSAQFRAGEDGNAALLGAAEIARRLQRPELLGEVVLAMCGWPRVVRHGRTANPELYPLLAEALAAPLAEGSVLRARLLAADALNGPEDIPLWARAARSQEALELARGASGAGRDEALYDALLARLWMMQAPDVAAARLPVADDLVEVAERLAHKERVFTARELRAQTRIALGQVSEADLDLAVCAEIAAELRLRRYSLKMVRFELERALARGQLDQIDALTKQAVQLRGDQQVSAGTAVILYTWGTYLRAFRVDRRWFSRQRERIAQSAAINSAMRGHVTLVYALFEERDEARRCYAPLLAPGELDGERDDSWLMTYTHVAEAAVVCGDREAAELLYPRLLPHRALNVTHFEWLLDFGSCEHFLGLLAGLLERTTEAREHFEAALAANRRMGERLPYARTLVAYAGVLVGQGTARARSSPARADRTRANDLLREAIELGTELGLPRLVQIARALVD